jgi:prefoldin subunit 2
MSELSAQAREHELVVDTIKDLDPERKCFRLIGGVLVERKVREVLPAVKGNKEKLDEVVKKIQDSLNVKEMELMELKRKYQIRERGEQAPGDAE